jgi:hypothetical protein
MNELYDSLHTAMVLEAVPDVLAMLFDIAVVLMCENEKERAFQIIALARRYPMHDTLHMEMEAVYDDLQFQMCPRVVADANERADEITLEDMVMELLSTSAS